jgi:hypothetical protein
MIALNGIRSLFFAHSAISKVPTLVDAVKEKNKENSINAGLTVAQSISYYLQTRAALFTGISALSARLLSYEFKARSYVIPPLASNIIGTICCIIDGMLEAKGILYCSRFLNNQVPSLSTHLVNQLQDTAKIQDSVEKKQTRIQLIEKILPQLIATPQTLKIASVYKRVVENEGRTWGWAQQLLSLISKPITYAELEKLIEVADAFSKLQTFKDSHFKLTEAEQKELENCAEKNHPNDLSARDAYKFQKVESQVTMKRFSFERCAGETFTKKIQNSFDSLLSNLVSEDPEIQSQALSDTNKMLTDTQIQVKKMRFIHIVGLISAILTTASFIIAIHIFCAPAIPLILAIIGTIIYVVRYLLMCELMENEGWEFSLTSSLNRGIILPIKTNLIDPIANRFFNVQRVSANPL